MCGILGKVTFGSRHESEVQFDSAVAMLKHRGPDDCGAYHDKENDRYRLSFGHTRLSILDLSIAGHQPMINPVSGTVCTYNGEIYNFRDVREVLKAKGYTFKSECDTEVVIAAYDEWQTDFVKHFVGMFAIAIYDRRRRKLVLARDRLGIKPLYFYWDGGQFAFASEITALATLPSLTLDVCQAAIHNLLMYGYIPGELSIYQNVRKLRPGHLMTIELDRPQVQPERYWSALDYYNGPPAVHTEDEAVEALTEELQRAVDRRLISDVPLGAFLSGGIDSSLVVALMQRSSTTPVKTFTIGFSEPDFDEAPAAREIARYLGTEHTELYIDENTVRDIAMSTGEYFDEPFADTSAIPTLALSRMTREHVTVALSGDGGDELFWGYNSYAPRGYRLYEALEPLPQWVRQVGGSFLERMPVASIRARGYKAQFTDLVDYFLANQRIVLGVRYPKLHACSPTDVDALAEMYRTVAAGLQTRERDVLTGAMDLHGYMPDDILTKVDRATMSVSLEGRVPILDHNVVQLAASIPITLKNRGGQLKHLLRRVLANHIPQDLWERPKKGFGVPIARWLRTSLQTWAHDELFSSDGSIFKWIDKGELRLAFDDHQSGRFDNKNLIWSCIQLAQWDRMIRRVRTKTGENL